MTCRHRRRQTCLPSLERKLRPLSPQPSCHSAYRVTRSCLRRYPHALQQAGKAGITAQRVEFWHGSHHLISFSRQHTRLSHRMRSLSRGRRRLRRTWCRGQARPGLLNPAEDLSCLLALARRGVSPCQAKGVHGVGMPFSSFAPRSRFANASRCFPRRTAYGRRRTHARWGQFIHRRAAAAPRP